MRPGRSFRVSGLIHVILMIQYVGNCETDLQA